MHIDINVLTLQPLIALIFGILILILPRILNYLVAVCVNTLAVSWGSS